MIAIFFLFFSSALWPGFQNPLARRRWNSSMLHATRSSVGDLSRLVPWRCVYDWCLAVEHNVLFLNAFCFCFFFFCFRFLFEKILWWCICSSGHLSLFFFMYLLGHFDIHFFSIRMWLCMSILIYANVGLLIVYLSYRSSLSIFIQNIYPLCTHKSDFTVIKRMYFYLNFVYIVTLHTKVIPLKQFSFCLPQQEATNSNILMMIKIIRRTTMTMITITVTMIIMFIMIIIRVCVCVSHFFLGSLSIRLHMGMRVYACMLMSIHTYVRIPTQNHVRIYIKTSKSTLQR